MITVTVGNVLDHTMPDAYFNSVHCIYVVRDRTKILYVGKAERQSTHVRLLQHLAATVDANYRGFDLTPSELGRVIQENAPESQQWQIDLLTLSDCQSMAGAGRQRPATVDQAERFLIKHYVPMLNRVNSAQPAAQPNTKRHHSSQPKALPRFAIEYLGGVSNNRKTQDTYRYALQRFQQFGESAGYAAQSMPIEPTRLQRNVLVEFVAWMQQEGSKNNTIRTFVAIVRQYFLWLQGNNLMSPDLRVEEIELALEKTVGPHMRNIPHEHRLADDKVGQVLNYYGDLVGSHFPNTPRGRQQKLACLRNHAILQTLYSTAGRAGEVAALPRSAIDKLPTIADEINGSQNMQPVGVDVVGRGGKSRPIFLTLDAIKAIRAYLSARDASELDQSANWDFDQSTALFIRHDRSNASAISTKTVWQIVDRAAKKVFGVDHGGHALKRVGPSDFRHLRAQNLFDDGMPLDTLQAMLGHSSVLTTRRAYGDYPARERLADEIARFGRNPNDAAGRK